MPDWIFHIGVAKAVTRPWRGLYPRWLVRGVGGLFGRYLAR